MLRPWQNLVFSLRTGVLLLIWAMVPYGVVFAQLPPAVQAVKDSLLVLLETPEDSSSLVALHLELGELYAPHSLDDAAVHYNQVIEFSSEDHRVNERLKALNGLAQAHLNFSQYERSIALYFQAIRLAEARGINDQAATAYNGLGINYYYRGEYTKSADYTQRAADLLALEGHSESLSVVLLNLAGIYALSGDVTSARQRISEAEQLALSTDDRLVLFKAYNTLGTLYRLHTTYSDSAMYYYNRCLELAREQDEDEWVMIATYNLGESDLIAGRLDRAERHIREALELSRKLRRNAFRLEIYNSLSDIYAQTGRHEAAYRYKVNAYLLNDSLFAQDKQKAIEELELLYESEKKERQIQAQNEVIQSQQLEAERARRRQDWLVYALTLAIVLGGGGFWYVTLSRRRKARHEREKHFIYQHIAHEIKTPLTLIRAPLRELARKSALSSSDELRLVMENSDRLAELVDELFDADRLQQGTYRFEYVTGHPIGQIEQIITNFEAAYPEAAFHRLISPDDTLWSYPADALHKILSNLLTNALKYGGQPPQVYVTTRIDDQRLHLEVRDNGKGLSAKERRLIFARYQRLPQHANVAGAGIGLALVGELLTQLNGSVRVDNHPDGGACFFVSLPLKEAVTPVTAAPVGEEDERPLLLIAEDHTALAGFTAQLFEGVYRTAIARNGKEGLELAQARVPDLVLSDVMMPEADGLELLSHLKNDELTRHIPVVLFSARDRLADRLAGLQCGADAYIAKPYEPDELRLVIANLLETAARNRERYREKLQDDLRFEERVRSEHPFIDRLIALIIEQIDNSAYSVNELARDAGVSRSQLHRKLAALTGYSTSGFIRMIRLEHAFDLLKHGDCNVAEAAYRSGFGNPSYFTTSFTEHFGKRPSELRKTAQ